TPSLASLSAKHRPTGPAPTISTRLRDRSIRALDFFVVCSGAGRFFFFGRDHVLHRADPTIMGDVEDDAVAIAIFAFVERVRRGRPSREILRAGIRCLFLRLGEVVDKHTEMVEARLFIALHLEKREIHRPVRKIDSAPCLPDALQIEGLLIESRGSLDVRDYERDVTKFCHGGISSDAEGIPSP